MTALSGDQLADDLFPLTPALERTDAVVADGHRDVRTPGEIFPLRDDATRAREMQETWRAFGTDMADAVGAALDSGRSPPEIAYAIGEIVHSYFRTRGVTLASYELRRLVAELLKPRESLVVFARPTPIETSWTGDETATTDPVIPDVVFASPPSPLVDRTPHGAGPLDRLWADRSIDAVFVNGPAAIQVERKGALEASAERFRDAEHLQDFVRRLVPHAAPAAAFRLRDGGEGLVIFPPAAPDGPILALRRGATGEATFERLVAAAVLTRPMADLLVLAARCRLNVVVVGPAGCGKTALLAAIAAALSEARVVTLARHRAFRRPSASRIELIVPSDDLFATLLAASVQLAPHLLVVDPVRSDDRPALAELLARGGRGIATALEPAALADLPRAKIDLVVGLGRLRDGLCGVTSIEDANGSPLFAHDDGRFHRRPATPSFAGLAHEMGHGAALASVLA